jgi:hypothetical protein
MIGVRSAITSALTCTHVLALICSSQARSLAHTDSTSGTYSSLTQSARSHVVSKLARSLTLSPRLPHIRYIFLNDTLVAPIWNTTDNVTMRSVWIPPGIPPPSYTRTHTYTHAHHTHHTHTPRTHTHTHTHTPPTHLLSRRGVDRRVVGRVRHWSQECHYVSAVRRATA